MDRTAGSGGSGGDGEGWARLRPAPEPPALTSAGEARRAGQLSAVLYVGCGLLVLVAPLLTEARPGADEGGQVVVGLAAVASGALVWFLPWERWGLYATLAVVPLAFGLIVLHHLVARDPFSYALFFMVACVWIGLTHRQGTTLLFAPLLAVAFLVPLLTQPATSPYAWGALVYVVPTCVLTGEAIAWVAQRVRRAEAARLRWRREVQDNEARFRTMLENASDMVSVVAPDGSFRFHYPPTVMGYEPGSQPGATLLQFVHPDDLPAVEVHIGRVLDRPGRADPVEVRILHADGTYRWFECVATNLCHDPLVGAVVINSRDVTERRRAEVELEHQALHDSVTGLPNRALLLDRLGHAAARQATRGDELAVLFCDLDHFKVVNDSLGHEVGDRVLVEVADRLRSVVRPPDTVARFGGDEFVLLCEEVRSPEAVAALADRLHRAVERPLRLDGHVLHLTASVGVVVGPATVDDPRDLIRDADAAMYAAKTEGRARTRTFDAALRAAAVARLEIEGELRSAIADQQLEVWFQPLVELDGGAPVGAEALLRWRHPTRGLLGPGEFIPVAEQTGLIVPVGTWVLEEACRQAASWPVGALGPLTVSVNLSARQLERDDLPEVVAVALGASGLVPGRLCLEITESMMLHDPEATDRRLRALSAMGVRLSVDDFGTGYSSLSYLQRFTVDELKIDRSFVAQLARDDDPALVRSIVMLGQSLGLDVVAEGVESAAIAARLHDVGCRLAQGYEFSRPVPPEAIAGLFAERAASRSDGSAPGDRRSGAAGAADVGAPRGAPTGVG